MDPSASCLLEPVALPRRERREAVLCVDDEPQVLTALRRTLRREPYDVITAPDAPLALECLERLPIEVVLADERMPLMSGTQLLGEVRRRWPWMGLAILTGYPGRSVMIRGLRAGIDRLLYKPWDDDALKRTIRKLLQEAERARAEEEEGPEKDVAGDAG
jgi:DNA-binding response OmpR family regulator